MAEVANKKPDTMVLEWINQRDSGYRRDDLKGSPIEGKITCGSQCFIPNTGKMAKEVEENGKKIIVYVPIRYIKGSDEIEVSEQKKRGIEPSSVKTEDQIVLEKGSAIIKDEGDRGLFKYLAKVFYNEDAPHRSKKAIALFRVAKKDQKLSDATDMDFARSKAVQYVSSLVKKVGKAYEYNETKIDNAMTVLGLGGGDDYVEKVSILTHEAKSRPVYFLQLVTKLEDEITTEITHALELGVISFKGTVVEFTDDKVVLATFGDDKLNTQPKKITKLSELLRTPEYQDKYKQFKLKLEIAQENSLKQ